MLMWDRTHFACIDPNHNCPDVDSHGHNVSEALDGWTFDAAYVEVQYSKQYSTCPSAVAMPVAALKQLSLTMMMMG